MVFVVNATRSVSDVTLRAARRLLSDGADNWSDIGQGSGRLRVVRATGRSADRAVQRVRSDRSVLAVVPADAVDGTVRALTVGGRHPLRHPRSYPLQLAAHRPVPEVTTLTMVGDLLLARRVGCWIRATTAPAGPLRPLAGRLASAEITVGNFESTLSRDGNPTQGGDSFGADADVVDGLKLAGIDLVSLANNHVGDYGDRALRRTLQRFAGRDVAVVGAGRNLDEARGPVIVQRDGVRVGFIGTESIGETPAATSDRAGTNRLNMPPRTGPLNRKALRRITGDIEAVSRKVDVVVVIPHWGTQYTHRPEPSQREAARAFAAAGADLVIGSHPHWVQGWEVAKSAVIVHSLGNFVFDMDVQTKTREGIFVEIVLWGGKVKAVEPVPYVIGGDFAPRRVSGDRAEKILSDVWRTSRGPFRSR
jgi:poly-gamma-glutamate synthesis protein (capsule biosynthesis protein)